MTTNTAHFNLERELLRKAALDLPSFLAQDQVVIATIAQATVGNVIPDLLIAYGESCPLLPARRFTVTEQHILAALLQDNGLKYDDLVSQLYLSDSGACAAVLRLKREEMIIESGEILFARSDFVNDFEIVAVETKLSRWRDALRQAKNYQTFANRSYVVMDGGRLSVNNEVLDAFRSSGVGLVLCDEERNAMIVEAESVRTVTSQRIQAIQRMHRVARTSRTYDSADSRHFSKALSQTF